MSLLLLIAILLVTLDPLWAHMPKPLSFIQFPYRLNSYLALAVAGVTGVTALMTQRDRGLDHQRLLSFLLRSCLVITVLVSLGTCVWQLWVPNTVGSPSVYANRSRAAASPFDVPASWYESLQYSDRSEPVVSVPIGRAASFSPLLLEPGGSRLDARLVVPAGTAPFLTNVVAGPYLATIGGGIERVGRSATGFAVVRRVHPGSGPVHVVIGTADTTGVVLGRVLTVGSMLLVLAVALLLARRSRTPRDR